MRFLLEYPSFVYWKAHMETFIMLTLKEEVNKYATESTQKYLTCTQIYQRAVSELSRVTPVIFPHTIKGTPTNNV